MARIRSIKPEFWTDEKVVAVSPLARLLFIGIWNFVDDEGRAAYSPSRFKMQILPADSADVSELLGEIRRENMVTVYLVDGKEYLQVNGFTKHQKIDKRTPSKLPPPPTSSELPRNVPLDQGREGKVEEEKERKKDPACAADLDLGPELSAEDQFWNLAPQFSSGGIPRSRMGALAKSCGGDFVATLRIAQDVLKAKQPSSYLGKIMANQRIEAEPAVRRATFDPDLPAFVSAAKAEGMPVEKHPKGWRIGGVIFDPQGEEIGW